MSRSYKHTPHCYIAVGDANPGHRKAWKQAYNRSIRRKYNNVDPRFLDDEDDYDDGYDGGRQFKKMNNRWNIDDGSWVTSWPAYRDEHQDDDPKETYRDFYVWYVRK